MGLRLRPDQEAVAGYRSGYMAVPAVPGAGKTTVLAYLAADLIAAGLPQPGRILIVTYTNSAVGNFRSRIGSFLEERGYPRGQGYEVRTIHSLALQIVRERPEAIGWSENFLVMDEHRLTALLNGLTRRWIGQHRSLWESLLKDSLKGATRSRAEEQWEQRTQQLLRTLIQSFKARQISPHEAFGLTRSLPEESALRWAADLYGEYQRELAIEGAVDFGDLMLGAYQLLHQQPDLLQRLQHRWRYIFEDEAQDSYRLQEQLLRLLAGPAGNLVRVGDANQAIMGTFTSAEPDLFRRFTQEEGVLTRPLTMAGRSSPDVLDLANELVRWTRKAHPEPACRTALEAQWVQPVPPGYGQVNPCPSQYTIRCRTYATAEEELVQVAHLATRSATRSPEKSLAILVPTNAMATAICELLGQIGAPYQQIGGQTAPERLEAGLRLITLLDFLARPHRGEALLEALKSLLPEYGLDQQPLGMYFQKADPAELFFPWDGAAPFESLYQAVPACRGDAALEEALAHLRRWLGWTGLPADELPLRLAAELGLQGEELATAHYLALRIRLLLQERPAIGLSQLVEELRLAQPSLGRFTDSLYDRQGFEAQPGIIYVTTCHSAKGLEWDTVFVPALTRGEFPAMVEDKIRSEHWYLADEYLNPEALALAELDLLLHRGPGSIPAATHPATQAKLEIIAERLRLLYVAITRARENLLLSCHLEDRWSKPAHPTLAYQHLKAVVEARQRGERG